MIGGASRRLHLSKIILEIAFQDHFLENYIVFSTIFIYQTVRPSWCANLLGLPLDFLLAVEMLIIFNQNYPRPGIPVYIPFSFHFYFSVYLIEILIKILIKGQLNINIIYCKSITKSLAFTINNFNTAAMSQVTVSFKALLIGVMTITGAINTLAYKFQNKQLVYEGSYYKYFFHPYMQCVTMFFGEALALVIYHVMKRRDPEGFKTRMLEARNKGKQVKMNKLLLLIPAAGDFFTSTLVYASLNFIPGSVYQMLRGGGIATTFFFSVVFLRAKVLKHQVAGSILALLGITIVGLSNLAFSDGGGDSASGALQIVGYILVVASLLFNGFYFVFEQKLLSKYHLQPLEVVGYQGVFGLCIYAVMLPIFTFLPCTFGQNACVFTSQSLPFWQRPQQYFAQAGASFGLTFFCILGIFSIAMFNITGVTITKYINALARSVADVARTIIVWIVGIIVTLTLGSKYPNYTWELINGWAILVQLFGFLILVFGNMVYNEIVKIPGLHQKAKDEALLGSSEDLSDNDPVNVSTKNPNLDISLQKRSDNKSDSDD